MSVVLSRELPPIPLRFAPGTSPHKWGEGNMRFILPSPRLRGEVPKRKRRGWGATLVNALKLGDIQ